MGTIEPGTVLTAGAMAVGVVIWLIRLEGRVNMQSALQDRLSADVAYIRARIDDALNGRE